MPAKTESCSVAYLVVEEILLVLFFLECLPRLVIRFVGLFCVLLQLLESILILAASLLSLVDAVNQATEARVANQERGNTNQTFSRHLFLVASASLLIAVSSSVISCSSLFSCFSVLFACRGMKKKWSVTKARQNAPLSFHVAHTSVLASICFCLLSCTAAMELLRSVASLFEWKGNIALQKRDNETNQQDKPRSLGVLLFEAEHLRPLLFRQGFALNGFVVEPSDVFFQLLFLCVQGLNGLGTRK